MLVSYCKAYRTRTLVFMLCFYLPAQGMDSSISLFDEVKKHPVIAAGATLGYVALVGFGVRYGFDFWENYQNRIRREESEKSLTLVRSSQDSQTIKNEIEHVQKHRAYAYDQLLSVLRARVQASIKNNNLTAVQLCLDSCQSPVEFICKPDKYSRKSNLGYAFEHDNVEVIELFRSYLEKDTSPYCTDPFIVLAVKYSAKKTLRNLLDDKHDINITTAHNGYTPLHYAVSLGCDEVVADLVAYGADVNALDNEGKTPLDLVTPNTIVDLLPILESEHLAFKPELLGNLLTAMVNCDHEPAIEWLLDHDVQAQELQESQETSFFIISTALKKANKKTIKLLLDKKPELIEAKSECGTTPLTLAAQEGQVGILKLLLQYRRKRPLALSVSLQEPLCSAARSKNFCTLQTLIEETEGQDNQEDQESRILALVAAIDAGQFQNACYLIEAMRKNIAFACFRNHNVFNGNTIWHLVAQRRFDEGLMDQMVLWCQQEPGCIAQCLVSRNNEGKTPIGSAMYYNNKKVLAFLQDLDKRSS